MLVVHTRIIHIASIVLVMCAVLLGVYFVGQAKDSTQLTVAVLDVGQGDAILVDGPAGQQILIDAGPDRSILAKLSEYMPFYDHDIELVILTHPHLDHYGGLHEVLNRYKVHHMYITGIVQKSPDYQDLLAQAVEKGVDVQEVWRGTQVDMGSDIHMSIFAPMVNLHDMSMSDLNESSIVAKLVYKQKSFLLTGDATDTEEKALLDAKEDVSADVLKVGHHGSEYSTSDTFLDVVHPNVAAISAGFHNMFGHPSTRLLNRLDRHDIQSFRTDQDGDIVFTTDGDTINVNTSSSRRFHFPWSTAQALYTIY
ncbi:MAG: MBL fold metallo-hydrolase [bacterium]|nr:MBL fold metallo-hydrolase [bacterium]